MSTSFMLNGRQRTVDVDPSKPLLWVIRENLGLTGNKIRLRHSTVWRVYSPG